MKSAIRQCSGPCGRKLKYAKNLTGDDVPVIRHLCIVCGFVTDWTIVKK